MDKEDMIRRIAQDPGFIAALDQSGGSTPNTLKSYGINEAAYTSEEEMFQKIHEMRARIIKSPAFTGTHVLGAILFERTMEGQIDGIPTARFLWETSRIVPFLKVDKGMEDEADGVQILKAMPELDSLLDRGLSNGIFGTKMRSVIKAVSETGISRVVDQQFEIAMEILAKGLVPIIEPEITISMPDKDDAEGLLCEAILTHLDRLDTSHKVMLKLTLPETANRYKVLADHPQVLRMVALSGGYDRATANAKLAQNTNMIASFSRALTEGLSIHQSPSDFDALLSTAVQSIYDASCAT